MNQSAEAFSWGVQLDFQGVLILVWGATIPIIHYAFVCVPKLQKLYWIVVSSKVWNPSHLSLSNLRQISLLAVVCSVFTFNPAFKTESNFMRPL